jgi:hypothetical protein
VKPRTLLVLLVLVAGLGAFIWFYERELPGSEERAEQAKRVFRGLEADEVAALVVEHGGERVRLERVPAPDAGDEEAEDGEDGAGEDGEDGEDAAEPFPLPEPEPEWRIAEPAALAGARADRFAVDRLLDSLTTLEKSRTLEDADRAEAGLDEPRARVTIVREGGEETTLEIGAEVPASTSALAALAGAPEVYVVGGGIVHDLDRAPGDWRDREILAVRRDEIERLTLAPAGGERIVLARRGGEEYWLDEPLVDRADATAVDQLVTDLGAVRAREFVDAPGEDLAAYGLDAPRGAIEIAAGGGEPLRLEIGGEAGGMGWYGRAGGQVFAADGQLPEALAKAPADWQSRALSARRLYQIDRVDVVAPGAEPLVLEREGPDWKRGGEAIPYTPVSDFLFAVTDARAERLARRDAARAVGDLGAPALTITLAGGAEGEGDAAAGSETITLYPPAAGGEVPAAVTGRDFALYLAPAAAETLRQSLERLREAEPLPPPEPAEGEDGEDGEDGADDLEVEVEEGG